jgi:hypothetical protein
MPFTLCHPAAIAALPSRLRRLLPLAALAIGSMAPDFEYLLRLKPLSTWSHTLPGLVIFCLPVGLVTWIAWEQIARMPTRELLALESGQHGWPMSAKTIAVAALAVLIGSVTHLGWDAFTHSGRLGTMLFPQLEAEVWTIGSYSLRLFSVFQHLSTVVGAVVIGLWYLRERQHHGTPWEWTPRGVILALILGVGVAVGLANAFLPHTLWNASHPGTQALLARFVVGAMVGIGGSLLAYGALRSRPCCKGYLTDM